MGFKDWLMDQKNNTVSGVKKFANKDFMEAIAAGCALIAAADGTIDSSEKQKMVGYINLNESLKVFNMNDVLARFNHYAQMFEFDFNVGKAEASKPISKLKKHPDSAKLLISVCCSIGSADGEFDKKEMDLVREMCYMLGLNPADFQL